jgi:hypothetical protein
VNAVNEIKQPSSSINIMLLENHAVVQTMVGEINTL